ncbi:MAG: carboxymuconolactone decarboxylase family protein [Pseudonocardia sp.]
MARIPLVDQHDDDADPLARALLAAAESAQPDIGVLNVHRALANHPRAMQKFFEFAEVVYFDNSLDDPKLRELPYLTSAVANNCFY